MTATDRVEGRDGTKEEDIEARGRFMPALGVLFMVCFGVTVYYVVRSAAQRLSGPVSGGKKWFGHYDY